MGLNLGSGGNEGESETGKEGRGEGEREEGWKEHTLESFSVPGTLHQGAFMYIDLLLLAVWSGANTLTPVGLRFHIYKIVRF